MKKPAKIAILIAIAVTVLGGGFAFKRHSDKQKEEAQLSEFISQWEEKRDQWEEKRDDSLMIMNASIRLSEEISNYYAYNKKPPKKKGNAETYFSAAALRCQNIVKSLSSLHYDTSLSNELLGAALILEETFDKEAVLSAEADITMALYNINGTVNAGDVKRIRLERLQNNKNIQTFNKSLSEITYRLFETHKQYLNEAEKEELAETVYSKFHESLLRTSKLVDAPSNSKNIVYEYDIPPFHMYKSLTAG